MDATEVTVIPTSGAYSMMRASKDGKPVLLIGLKEAYQEKPQYQKALRAVYDRCHDLDHPHLMKMTAFEAVGSYGNCIVNDFEDARTLAEYYKEGHSDDEKHDIVLQIAEALAYLHQNNIVHGALNPYMIYVTKNGDQVKIVNFRGRNADDLLASSKTARYVAPEAEDGTVALDGRADIYALGMIMKDLGLTLENAEVIQRCTGFGRSERYLDVDAFLSDFEHRRSTGGTSISSTYIIIAAVVLLIIAAVVWFVSKKSESSQEPAQPAPTEQTSQSVDSLSQQDNSADAAAQPQQAPDQTQSQQTYSGDMAFMNDLMPQVQKDIDGIYDKLTATATTPEAVVAAKKVITQKVKTYYKGVCKARLQGMSQAQRDAFDKAFGDYVSQKNQQLQ
jgi:serine/threonine protein kinase